MKLLKFYTTHCIQCQHQTKLLDGFTEVEVVSMDCDKHEDLVKKYGIRSVPTLVLIDEEVLVHKFIGMTKPDVIIDIINNYNRTKNERDC